MKSGSIKYHTLKIISKEQEKIIHSVACVQVTEKLKNLPEMSTSGGAPRRQTQIMPLAWRKLALIAVLKTYQHTY